jgi:hypothetical protein
MMSHNPSHDDHKDLWQLVPVVTKLMTDENKDVDSYGKFLIEQAKMITGAHCPGDAIHSLKNDPEKREAYQKAMEYYESLFLNDDKTTHEKTMDSPIQDQKTHDPLSSFMNNKRNDIMVLSAAFGLILCLVMLGWFHEGLPGEAVGILSMIAGIFGACLKDAYAFEFGSSRGSKEKDRAFLQKIDF